MSAHVVVDRVRRRALLLCGSLVLLALCSALLAPAVAHAAWPTVFLAKRFDGLQSPVFVTGDGTGERLYVVERTGKIRMARTGDTTTTVFLDLSAKIDLAGERGLLGLAFSPHYATNGQFYVYYVDAPGFTHVARFSRSALTSDLADPSTETTVMAFPRPSETHVGGWMQFGPDGQLYVSSGDGGPQGDPNGNAQSLATLFGKILRIDVESGAETYTVPADNPFVDVAGARPEIWAYGLRNPWRCSIDSAGNLFIGDVGHGHWEEIDLSPVGAKGLNFGWNIYEGAHPYPAGSVAQPATGLTFPIAEYPHPVGEAIVGGYLYEGSKYPLLRDTYFYADFLTGKMWGLQKSGTSWTSRLLLQNSLVYTSFGTDDAKNLYICSFGSGEVYEVCASRPTTCAVSTKSAVIAYAQRTAIAGKLTEGGAALAGMTVQLQSSASGTSWRNTGAVATTTADGSFSFTVAPAVSTYYRVRYGATVVGDVGYVGSVSAAIRLLPRVYLTAPWAPASVVRGQFFVVSALLKPRHAPNTYPVYVRCYRAESGKWVLRKTVRLRASDVPSRAYSRVSGRLSLLSKGTWRLVGYHPADALNASTLSSARTVVVK